MASAIGTTLAYYYFDLWIPEYMDSRYMISRSALMHFGKSYSKAVYCITEDSGNKREIKRANLERNLDVIVAKDLKRSKHVDRMVGIGQVNRKLGMLKKTF